MNTNRYVKRCRSYKTTRERSASITTRDREDETKRPRKLRKILARDKRRERGQMQDSGIFEGDGSPPLDKSLGDCIDHSQMGAPQKKEGEKTTALDNAKDPGRPRFSRSSDLYLRQPGASPWGRARTHANTVGMAYKIRCRTAYTSRDRGRRTHERGQATRSRSMWIGRINERTQRISETTTLSGERRRIGRGGRRSLTGPAST